MRAAILIAVVSCLTLAFRAGACAPFIIKASKSARLIDNNHAWPGHYHMAEIPVTSPVTNAAAWAAEFKVQAELDDDGTLLFQIYTKRPDGTRAEFLRGKEEFAKILRYFGKRVTGVLGSWLGEENLAQFNEGIAGGLSPEQAAWGTWTGQRAFAHGFTRLRFKELEGEPPYHRVKVLFTKP